MLGGIFVGGAGSRMNGVAKGLLRTPGGDTIVAHVARAMREAGLEPVLVGRRGEYATVGLRVIEDAANAGPIGGLVALLDAANGERVVAIACDMPFVTADLVKKLVHAAGAPIVAPRRDGRWEPLFARYDSARVLGIASDRCARGELALQGLLDAAGAVPLELGEADAAKLTDWDSPEDVGATAKRNVTVVERGETSSKLDSVAVEEPLEIRCGPDPISITMRTPGADADLAVGFLVGEGVIRTRADVVAAESDGPNAVSVTLTEEARARVKRAKRAAWSTSSCGICGKDSLDQIHSELPEAKSSARFSAGAITRMPDALRAAQPIFDRTGAIHAAGLADARGVIVSYAEDVGRHNAVDKVLGRAFMERRDVSELALVLSGRVAFELVQKAAVSGVAAIVAIGAPTSLAVELAERAGLVLVGFARGERFNVYAGASRVTA
ncbi:MAG TPA: formate dehydrogenase accessory sulfurtransferase FdhD [Polyangiaceae bacterium]|nr:formate dehydrogenase accessory sulfurtransferase FdhD [Polyangiaceae bacterium]